MNRITTFCQAICYSKAVLNLNWSDISMFSCIIRMWRWCAKVWWIGNGQQIHSHHLQAMWTREKYQEGWISSVSFEVLSVLVSSFLIPPIQNIKSHNLFHRFMFLCCYSIILSSHNTFLWKRHSHSITSESTTERSVCFHSFRELLIVLHFNEKQWQNRCCVSGMLCFLFAHKTKNI